MCQVGGRVAAGKEGGGDGDAMKNEVKAAISNGGGSGNRGGCGFFEWAEFTDDGEPIWKHRSNDHLKKTPVGDDDAVLGAEKDKGSVNGRV